MCYILCVMLLLANIFPHTYAAIVELRAGQHFHEQRITS